MPFMFWNKIKKNTHKINKIIIFSPSIFFGLIIKKLKIKFKCKVVLIIRDIFPDWVLQKNIYLWFNPLFIFAKIVSNFQFYFSDVIAVQSYKDKKIIKRKYKYKNIQVLYNWITPKRVPYKKKTVLQILYLQEQLGLLKNGKILFI